MDREADAARLDGMTGRIIAAAQKVHSALAPGFLEKIYENALVVELALRGMRTESQHAIEIRYAGQAIGTYYPDLLVDQEILVEVKAVDGLGANHRAQCINYLRAADRRVCLLLNFGRPSLEVRRFVNRY